MSVAKAEILLHLKNCYIFAANQNPNQMKKILSILLSAGVVMLIACGPSAEEKAAAEKHIQDSLAAVQKHTEDSTMAAQAAAEKARQDSTAAAMEKMKQDSIEAAAKKKPAKTIEQKKKENAKKATQGRG